MPLPGMAPGGFMGHDGSMHTMMSTQMMMAAAAAAAANALPQQRPIRVGRGVTDPAAYAHKLFIGQIPFEATEHDLVSVHGWVGGLGSRGAGGVLGQ